MSDHDADHTATNPKTVTIVGYTVIFGFLTALALYGVSSYHYKATHEPSPAELARMTGSEP